MMIKRYILLGAGAFGRSWAHDILPGASGFAELVGVCDSNRDTHGNINRQIPVFTDINAAITALKPDAVINVTAPDKHTELNIQILSQGIAVLCEKPISETYDDARKMMDFARKSKAIIMISENYRYHAAMRKTRELIFSGMLGQLRSLSVFSRQHHPDASNRYHGQLAHPLLTDVTVHHLDLARYLSGQEPEIVHTLGWQAPHTWYRGRIAGAVIYTKMTNNVVFTYNGSLASPVSTTDWGGMWEIECDDGVLQATRSGVRIIRENEEDVFIPCENPYDDSRLAVLKEFNASICDNRKGETDIEDNYKSFIWMHAAVTSVNQKREVEISEFL